MSRQKRAGWLRRKLKMTMQPLEPVPQLHVLDESTGPDADVGREGDLMGRFIYSPATKVEIEDRAMAHVQHVIGAKLRRGECFYFTWKEDASVGGGRRSVWMHPGVFVEFRYHGSRTPALNREWLEALAYAANTPHGLYVVPEPAPGSLKAPASGPTPIFRLNDET